MTKIYTKTGDKGDTGLFGGQRITKGHPRIESYGCIDELNAYVGMTIALLKQHLEHVGSGEHVARSEAVSGALSTVIDESTQIQHMLFVIGAHLSTPYDPEVIPDTLPSFEVSGIAQLEEWIDSKEQTLEPLKHFILPSGSVVGASVHISRTVCRRAERAVIRLSAEEAVLSDIVRYLNRLSDYLFVTARYVNHYTGALETPWQK